MLFSLHVTAEVESASANYAALATGLGEVPCELNCLSVDCPAWLARIDQRRSREARVTPDRMPRTQGAAQDVASGS